MKKERLIEILWMILFIRKSKFNRKKIYVCENLDQLVFEKKVTVQERFELHLFLFEFFRNKELVFNHYAWLDLYESYKNGYVHRNNILLDAIAFVESTGTVE